MRAADVLARMASLPFADVATIAGSGPILVLAPHPDDESLGCGGLIAQACAAGIEVHVAILTDGSMSHPNSAAFPAQRLLAHFLFPAVPRALFGLEHLVKRYDDESLAGRIDLKVVRRAVVELIASLPTK